MGEKIKICGFILAAGRGERLRPLTDTVPKPLLPVNGGKMIDAAIMWFEKAGVKKIVVNGWYMKEKVFDYVSRECRKRQIEVVFSPEDDLMGTGGGILKALKYVNEEVLIVHNSDIISDLSPAGFIATFLKTSFPAFLACIPHVQGTTPLWLKDDRIYFSNVKQSVPVTYAGISAFRTSSLRGLKVEKCEFVSGILKPLNEKYAGVGGYFHRGAWCDGGTPEGYRAFRNMWKTLIKRAEQDGEL